MHDLALLVAGSLITTLDYKERRNIDEKTRHVSVGDDIDILSILTSSSKASRIRTFLCLNYFREIDCSTILSSFKLLRMLNMHLDFVPSSIVKLKYLRYLDLSSNRFLEKLPDSISKLQNLQTLRLSDCWKLEELPRDIKNLVNLKHLQID
jgi:Leucine-rich repeat (LRR) protein